MKLTSLTSIGAVALGLIAVGVGGYNLITTGCPFGTCDAPTTTAVSTTTEHSCALGCEHDHDAPVVSAAAVSEKSEKKEACCHGEHADHAKSCEAECTEKKAGCCEKDTPAETKTKADTTTDPKSPA
jgi:hypothetical protein